MQRLNSKRKSPVAISRFSLIRRTFNFQFRFYFKWVWPLAIGSLLKWMNKYVKLVFCCCFHELQINCMQHMFELQGTVSVFSSIENLCNAVTICLQHVQKTIRSVFFFVQFGLYADYKLSIPYSIRLLSLSDWIACCFFCCCRFVGNDGGVSPNWTQMEFALPQTIRNTLIYGSQVQSRNNIAMNIVFTISY